MVSFKMSRFYVKPENIKGDIINISGDEAHHIVDVMRLKKGDEVVAFDGIGTEFKGIIKDIEKKSVIVAIQEKSKQPALKTNITLAQAIPKSERMYYIIQKCTELGVRAIIPMVTERTIVRIKKPKQDRRLLRWSKIATGAAKQCGRSDVPRIEEISSFKNVVKKSSGYSIKIMPSLIGERKEIGQLVSSPKTDNALLLIGPEGGFSPAEVKLAGENGISLVSLGPYTLRSDTAPIAAMAVLNYALGNR